jgi:hypothetical protein
MYVCMYVCMHVMYVRMRACACAWNLNHNTFATESQSTLLKVLFLLVLKVTDILTRN